MKKVRDLTGQKFGRLTVLYKTAASGKSKWQCKCECGNETAVKADCLIRLHTKSCGCLQREFAAKHIRKMVPLSVAKITKHGMSHTLIYYRWRGMWDRCTNPNHKSFHRYGERGITVCDRWRDFEAFFADMGHPPTPQHSLDRKDNNKDYTPDNCKWSLPIEQGNNKRNNRYITYKGRTLSVSQWERELGFTVGLIRDRINAGWTVEKAFTTLPRGYKRAKQVGVSA